MKKLFLLLALIGMVATGCEMNDVPPVKQIHLELSHDSISINAGGGTASVTVFSNDHWEIEGTSDWCKPSVSGGEANKEGTVVQFVAQESYAHREATFYFICGEIRLELKVSQEQKDVIFADENDKFSIPAKGGVALIEYQTNVECEVIIPAEAQDWISLTSTRTLRDESIGLDVAPNESYDPRSAIIMVVAVGDNTLCAKYIINQEQTDVILAGEDNKFAVPSDGADVSIDFETNVKYNVNIPSNAKSWITLVDATRGIAPRSITLRVAKNTTYEKRSAVISITKDGASKPTVKYTIEQEQNDGIVFEGDTLLAPAKGGSVALDYQANVDCEVIIPDDAKEWISIDPQTRGLEKYSVTLVIAPNDSFDERTTAIKVEGESVSRDIEVKQMGIERVLSLSPSELDLPLEATNITIDVDANIDYEVVIADDCDWITMPEAENTIENKVILAIAENPTIYSRDTEILFKGDGKDVILPVVQRGDEGVLMLDDEYIADGQDTVLSIEFSSNFDYTVSIPCTCDWLSLPETRAVVQTHTVEFALTKNPTIDKRSVDVVFSDAKDNISKSVTITQLGSPIDCVVPNDNEVLYITTDGEKLNISETDFGSASVIGHTYEDGIGRITCSSVITLIDGFDDCTTLEQIAIPDSVTSIGSWAFSGCTSLTSITIPDSVTEIGGGAFYGCTSLTSITIPDSVTSIGNSAFSNCDSLTSVTIPDSVTTIGDNAFFSCTSLTSITIPDSVAEIGGGAFSGCTSLESVTIGNGVTEIGYYAFENCTSLTSITIPDSVTTIGNYAFYDCDSLTSVTIPDSVTKIGSKAFYGCDSLTSVTIPDGVTEIGVEAFYGCSSLTSITIPDSVTSIEDYTFKGCTSLTSITIPDSVTEIGEDAFYGCTGELIVNCNIPSGSDYVNGIFYGSKFTKVTIGDSVTSIGDYAFYGCDSLESVTIGSGVTSIGNWAFSGCSGELIINSKIIEKDYPLYNNPANSIDGWLYKARFTKITIGDNVTKIGDRAFKDCTSLTNVTIGNSVTEIGDRAFERCTSLTSITIGNGVTSIGDYAFYDCTSLTSINIPDSVTKIGSKAFYGCSSLTSITIPDSVTEIESGAFYGCTSLTSVTIPDSVTTIGIEAFSVCTSLTSITIGNGVTSIGDYAFEDCTSLTRVDITDIEAWCKISFDNSSFTNPLYYAHNLYLNGELVTDVVIPDSVTWIGDRVFECCTSLTSINIPDSVTKIGSKAFFDCTSLTSITIPDSVTTIGGGAFYGCTSLTSVTIPNSVTTIGDYAFEDCDSLTSVTIPDSVTSIGYNTFFCCDLLTKVTIGSGVTEIGVSAFHGCDLLTSVYCKPITPPAGDYTMFYSNASDRKIYVPAASVEAYKSAAGWSNYADDIVGY